MGSRSNLPPSYTTASWAENTIDPLRAVTRYAPAFAGFAIPARDVRTIVSRPGPITSHKICGLGDMPTLTT